VAAVQSGITGTLRLGQNRPASTTQALPVAASVRRTRWPRCRSTPGCRRWNCRVGCAEYELDAAIAHFSAEDQAACRSFRVRGAVHRGWHPPTSCRPRATPMTVGGRRTVAACAADTRHENSPGHRQAFAECGAVVTPQVGERLRSLALRPVGVGAWASIVPHTWLLRTAGGRPGESCPTGWAGHQGTGLGGDARGHPGSSWPARS